MDPCRPAKSRQTLPVMRYKNIELDLETGRASKDGQPVALSPKERGRRAFLRGPGGPAFPRADRWAGGGGGATPLRTRTVDMHIRQLRRKLGPELDISTVFKVGYRLN